MWKASYEKVFRDVTRKELWYAWADVNHWLSWDDSLESTRLEGPFAEGAQFELKPKGGMRVRVKLVSVIPFHEFTDVTRLPMGEMYDQRVVEDAPGGVRIKSAIWVKGPLAGLWRMLVAQGVAASVPAQTERLVQYVRAARS